MASLKTSIIGLGYVGIPLLVSSSQSDQYNVVGYDISEDKIQQLSHKQNPIDDEHIDSIITTANYSVSSNASILDGSDLFFITVPTPVLDDYTPDYSYIISAGETVAQFLKQGAIVVLESTVNPGTTEEIFIPLLEKITQMTAGVDFDVAYCPERIDPGNPNWNVTNIPRNLGATRLEAAQKVKSFYESFIDAEINIVSTLKTAEASKIVENTFRDVNIAFVNELAQSFDALEIDVKEVLEAASNKPFGYMRFFPSLGVGGHCIPVDPYYLIDRAQKSGFDHRFLKLAREINNNMPSYTVHQLSKALNDIERSIKGTTITLLGMSYKANVGDMRESPAIEVLDQLIKLGADVRVYDPYIEKYNNFSSTKEAIAGATAIIVATPHKEFLGMVSPKILKENSVHVLIDGHNALSKKEYSDYEIIYKGIGR